MAKTTFFVPNNLQPASEIRSVLDKLPTCRIVPIFTQEGNKIPKFGAVEVKYPDSKDLHYVYCPKNKYTAVTHKDAFSPVIDGLTGYDFGFTVWHTNKSARLTVFTQGAGYDTVQIGVSAYNSYDGSSSINYGFRMFSQDNVLELVGYRQVCSNGMKIRVPLQDAEIIKEEQVLRIKKLLFEQEINIIHSASAESKIAKIKYAVEALALLTSPVERMIKDAQKWKLKGSDLAELVTAFIGKRSAKTVLAQYKKQKEGENLWGLYNAMTFVASHDGNISASRQERLFNQSAEMLLIPSRARMAKQEVA